MIPNNHRKAKPIFKEEKEFIESSLPEIGKLPDGCWIVGGGTKYVYLDLYCELPYIKFRCNEGGAFELLKDNREKLKDYKQTSIEETLNQESERINSLYDNCVKRTVEFVKNNPHRPYTVSLSGGKDSVLLKAVWEDVLKEIDFDFDWEYIFFNTTNEVADVYKYIKSIPNIKIINPEIGWRQWIKQKNYNFPTIFKRSCCSVYKEGQAKKTFNNDIPLCQVMGVRNKESNKRANYEFLMDAEFDIKLFGDTKLPKPWVKLAPIINLETVDVWLLMLEKQLFINRRYRLGFSRVGCLICPYSNAYEDALIKKYYSHQYSWFVNAIAENYKRWKGRTLGWTLQEWIDGSWKRTKPKREWLIHSEATPENISRLAKEKGISEEMAAKFFERQCGNCGKKCTENEIGMFFKLFGRYEETKDNRSVLCKKCACKKSDMTKAEYSDMMGQFYDQGCSLFG